MAHTPTPAQRDQLKSLLLKHQAQLQQEMGQNQENLLPPSADQGGMVQRNVDRDVDQALTDLDASDLVRIDRALKAMADGSYGACRECGCAIPFDRLKIEPQTEHCVGCKGRWEAAAGQV